MANRFLVHVLFNRDLCQRPAIVALVATYTPFLDPLFLDIGLPAFRTDKDAFFVMNYPFFFHGRLSPSEDTEGLKRAKHGIGSVPIASARISPGTLCINLLVPLRSRLFRKPLEFLFDENAAKHLANEGLGKL